MAKTDLMQTLKGFRDFIGPEAKKREWLLDQIKQTFEIFGYEQLESPALEYDSLLSGKYGDEADKLIFRFEDRGGRKVAMRYDQTVPTARIISQYQNELVLPFKRYQIQPVWRADKPQKGRYREFLQCDADIIGSNSSLSDAEILTVYYQIYVNIGLESIKIKVNDRQQLIKSIKDANIPEESVLSIIQTIDKLDKKTETEVIEELVRKNIAEETAQNLLNNLKKQEPSQELNTILKQAVQLGVPESVFDFTPTLARGLDYYTGLIFEGYIPEYSVGSVGGGGRYDNLIEELVGVSQPAVGFGLGFDRTLEAAEQLNKLPDKLTNTQVLVTIFSPDLAAKSLEVAQALRSQGIATDLTVDPDQKMQKQLIYADRKSIPFVIILGPEEIENNTVTLKNMSENTQALLSLDEVIQKLLS